MKLAEPIKPTRRNLAGLLAVEIPDDTDTELAFPTSEARMTGAKGPTRVMYIENKTNGLTGPARIGRVSFSKTGKTLYYRGQKFQSLKGDGFKSNYFEVGTGEHYWISGLKRNGQDALYGGGGTEIDEDCRQEYWTQIRRESNRSEEKIS